MKSSTQAIRLSINDKILDKLYFIGFYTNGIQIIEVLDATFIVFYFKTTVWT
jgi:hypothetical protein